LINGKINGNHRHIIFNIFGIEANQLHRLVMDMGSLPNMDACFIVYSSCVYCHIKGEMSETQWQQRFTLLEFF
jgi:hypothetical protein